MCDLKWYSISHCYFIVFDGSFTRSNKHTNLHVFSFFLIFPKIKVQFASSNERFVLWITPYMKVITENKNLCRSNDDKVYIWKTNLICIVNDEFNSVKGIDFWEKSLTTVVLKVFNTQLGHARCLENIIKSSPYYDSSKTCILSNTTPWDA